MKGARAALRALRLSGFLKRQVIRGYFRMRHPTYPAEIEDLVVSRGDYFRYSTMALALQRVLSDGIPGDLAEVGVYRGDASVLLHRMAPARRLFLFDTFEGFAGRDLPAGVEDRRFRDTGVEAVLRAIGDPTNVVVRKGTVPETFEGLGGERFAFVLLDLDLEAPTRAALAFFHPRMSPGGYLVVHDYNSPESGGAVKRAVDEFLRDKPERPVEIGDFCGSLLLRKA